MLHSIAINNDSEYNALYPDYSDSEDSAMEYAVQLERRIKELSALLACCQWDRYERRELERELREVWLTYHELKILTS